MKNRLETMTSRQRVTEAINHRVPDRMPIDLGMYSATGISAFAYQNLREYLGLDISHIEMAELVQGLARVDTDILERFHCDCVLLNPPPAKAALWNPRGEYSFWVPDYFRPERNAAGDWVVKHNAQQMRMPGDGFFFDGDWIAFQNIWEEPVFNAYTARAEMIFKETEYFTAFRGFYPFYDQNMDYFCDMLTDPDALIEKNARRLPIWKERAGRVIDAMGGHIGAICMSGDLGGQNTPMCRPDDFEWIVMPFLKELTGLVHRNSDLKVFLHCCGAIEPLIPLLIESGIDILNPVQISADGMAPRHLKEKYRKDIVFWGGGVDTQHVLGACPPPQVRENVRELVRIFKQDGGYVFNPVHNIMGNVSPESIVAVYDTAYEESFPEA